MILAPKYCWKRVQKHRINFGIQYHDPRTSIRTYIAGKGKKSMRKDHNYTNPALFGGDLLQLVFGCNYSQNRKIIKNRKIKQKFKWL